MTTLAQQTTLPMQASAAAVLELTQRALIHLPAKDRLFIKQAMKTYGEQCVEEYAARIKAECEAADR